MLFEFSKPVKALKVLNIVFFVSLFLQVLFVLIVHFATIGKDVFIISDPLLNTYIQYVVIALVLSIVPLNEFIIKKRLQKIKLVADADKKFEGYFILSVIKLALIEAAGIASTVFYFLSGHKTFLYMAIVFIILFIIERPAKSKINIDLGFDF